MVTENLPSHDPPDLAFVPVPYIAFVLTADQIHIRSQVAVEIDRGVRRFSQPVHELVRVMNKDRFQEGVL